MEIVAMALSEVNVRIVAALNHNGVKAIGLSGADANTVTATAMGETWQRAGMKPVVSTALLTNLLDANFVPVMSPLALDAYSELLNCNADTIAGAVASSLDAELVLLSDIDQLRADADDASSAIDQISLIDLEILLASGAAREGMRPKVAAALEALQAGATSVVLANGTRAHALSGAIARSIPTTEIVQ
jgi:acetylglutamate kinase